MFTPQSPINYDWVHGQCRNIYNSRQAAEKIWTRVDANIKEYEAEIEAKDRRIALLIEKLIKLEDDKLAILRLLEAFCSKSKDACAESAPLPTSSVP